MEKSKQCFDKFQKRTKWTEQYKIQNWISSLVTNLRLLNFVFQKAINLTSRVKNEKSIAQACMLPSSLKMKSTHFAVLITILVFANGANVGLCSVLNGDSASVKTPYETLENIKSIDLRRMSVSSSQNQASLRIRRDTVNQIRIYGIRLEDGSTETNDGIPSVLTAKDQMFRIFGHGLQKNTVITFTNEENDYGGPCLKPATDLFAPLEVSSDGFSATYKVIFPASSSLYYICAKNAEDIKDHSTAVTTSPLEHQGNSKWLRIQTYEPFLPIWVAITIIVVCLCFSALFSGLNLGLMAMDRTELKILRNTGTEKEKKYAAKIAPVRDQGNYLLCSILLGNVLVNSTFTILLDGLTSGLFAVIFSTLAIVLFGEITPQAVCSRHGLAIGAKTILVTKTVMAITAPLSYPISRILDALLGEEIGNVYNRERLKELVRVTNDINDLDKNEVNIISGALELRKKTVADVMTHIDDAFMLSLEAVLDFETVSEIMNSGYSRIPVFDGDRKNIVTLLYIKDLAFVDTDDNTPLKTLCEFYQNPVHFVFEDYTLDIMFNQFKEGTIGHIAFVHRVNNEGDGDPFYETVGLVTLEDVIEELIQAEIVDETDVFVDNRTKVKRNRYKKADFSAFAERREIQAVRISPQLTLATFQYLSTAVDAFKKDVISEPILRRLLNQDVFHNIKSKGKSKDDPSLYIFTQGKAVDFFVLILEGRVEVTIGKEALMFESGPFTYFGTQALVQNVVIDSPTQMGSLQSLNMDSKIRQSFVPDYSVRAITDVIYIAIKRVLYLTAKKATLLDKSRKSGTFSSETFDDEVERLLHSISEDEKPRYLAANQSTRRSSKPNRSLTSSPTNIDLSHDEKSNSPSVHIQGDQKIGNTEPTEDASMSSLVASDAGDLQNGEQDDRDATAASTPLLSKPEEPPKQ
ncbi:metal transporter CNNM4 isoform X1 [Drosophila subobscura]|uniref:metal transporter CNNM4 isoform X1 n=2 Tax=Drosophila subobscura TaxID=7241 RepID=UPI00155A0C47|nr:metal transporter CNNM4 isoform X1 [Drosophila subobscura]